jgi:hypothetical protein
MSKVPMFDRSMKPDFMAPGPKVKVEIIDGSLEFDDNKKGPFDPVSALDPEQRPTTYYQSDKVLGKLYRLVDEKGFYESLHAQSNATTQAIGTPSTAITQLWKYVVKASQGIQYTSYLPLARDIRETYEANVYDSMHRYALHPSFPLHEIEVVSGCMLGSVFVRRLKENVVDMRESFADDVAYIRNRIRMDEEGNSDEALPRAIACLEDAMASQGLKVGKEGRLLSYRYIAAAVCLEELERFHGGLLQRDLTGRAENSRMASLASYFGGWSLRPWAAQLWSSEAGLTRQ